MVNPVHCLLWPQRQAPPFTSLQNLSADRCLLAPIVLWQLLHPPHLHRGQLGSWTASIQARTTWRVCGGGDEASPPEPQEQEGLARISAPPHCQLGGLHPFLSDGVCWGLGVGYPLFGSRILEQTPIPSCRKSPYSSDGNLATWLPPYLSLPYLPLRAGPRERYKVDC